MFGTNFRRPRPGRPIPTRSIGRPQEATEGLARVRFGGGLAATWIGGTPHVRGPGKGDGPGTWIQIIGTPGIDGGYPWQPIAQLPTIQVTDGGTGYTSATASWSGGNGTGAVIGPCVVGAAGTAQAGKVLSVPMPTPGAGFVTMDPVAAITISGDGSGATAVVNGMAWAPTGSQVTSGDMAYEARGCRSVPADGSSGAIGTPYLAGRSPNGQLFFFCRPTLVVRTVIVATYPTTASVYYGVQTLQVQGIEAEGGASSNTVFGGTFFALNLGTAIPPVGFQVIATWTPSRWAFRYDAG